jgi:hypothetical protein
MNTDKMRKQTTSTNTKSIRVDFIQVWQQRLQQEIRSEGHILFMITNNMCLDRHKETRIKRHRNRNQGRNLTADER